MIGIVYFVGVVVIQIAVLIITYRVAVNVRKMVKQSAEDRELIFGILKTVQGWTVSVDVNDKLKIDQIQQAANTAATVAVTSANEIKKVIKETISTAVDTTSARVSEMLDQKAAAVKGDSGTGSVPDGVLGVVQVQRSPETH